MREVTIKLFTVNELTGKAKEKAIEWGRQMISETVDSDNLTEQMREHVEDTYGVTTDKCYWSLNYCQGDGVAFYGDLDLVKLTEKQPAVKSIIDRLMVIDNTASVRINGENSRYHHWNSMNVNVEVDHGHRYSEKFLSTEYGDLDDEADALANELKLFVQELMKTASRAAEKFGYESMEADREDENVIEMLEANEYTFIESGKRFIY